MQPLSPQDHAQLQRITIAPSQKQGSVIHLNRQQQHYLGRVLRLRTGDRFIAMDGQSQGWLVTLTASDTEAQIISVLDLQAELAITITLVVALPKGSGFDDVVRQVTELGVTEMVPVISDRTLLQPSANKLERWRRIAQEAAEQSERQTVPTIAEPCSLADYWQQSPSPEPTEQRLICVTRQAAPHLLQKLQPEASQITIAIGPEGGWTEAEVERAIAAGYQPVSLGQRILRTVTAPLVATTLVVATLESKQPALFA